MREFRIEQLTQDQHVAPVIADRVPASSVDAVLSARRTDALNGGSPFITYNLRPYPFTTGIRDGYTVLPTMDGYIIHDNFHRCDIMAEFSEWDEQWSTNPHPINPE